jgi:hypothetical protein
MKKEGEREKEAGTKGSFTRIAKTHGRTVPEEARHDEHKPGKVGKKARMALAFESAAKNR